MKNETRARWIVVDDDTEVLGVIASLLAIVSEAEICSFYSPWHALHAFSAAPETFELVITDFDMPGTGMNGVDLRRHMHALSPSLRVLLATAGGMFTEEFAARSGFRAVLYKPFSIDELKQTLETVQPRAFIARNRTDGMI